MNTHRICSMIEELQQYKGRKKDALLYEAVKARLDLSFVSYEHDTNQSLEYLTRRNELNVAKKLASRRKQR